MEPELTEPQAGELIAAFQIARKYFPKTPAKDLLESIELCREAGGLFVRPSIVFAGFRYHPGQIVNGRRLFDIVGDWDVQTLRRLDLREGPIVHVMFFHTTASCQRVFRTILDALRVEGASAHRIKRDGSRVFSLRKNVRAKHVQN